MKVIENAAIFSAACAMAIIQANRYMESDHQKKLALIKDSFLNYYMKYNVCMSIKDLQLSLIEYVINS